MRTNFSDAQLSDPHIAAAERELRSCVHCGICTATCPTYNLLGDELDGPRGRIQLIQTMLESNAAPSETVVTHIDRCLSCLACVTACPSGVNYPRLIDEARAHIERKYRRPPMQRFLRTMFGFALTRRWALRLLLRLRPLSDQLMPYLPEDMREALLVAQSLPAPERARRLAKVFAPQIERRMRVALHVGCVQEVVAPAITAATVRVLTRLGADVTIVQGAGCCGSLNHHLGQSGAAERRAARLVADIVEAAKGTDFDAVVVTASGCGSTIRDYGHLLAKTPIADAARRVGLRVRDIGDVLLELAPRGAPLPKKFRVAHHTACSLAHGLGQGAAAHSVLTSLGFDVIAPRDTSCCGSAGVYNALQPEIAEELRNRKLATLAETAPDIIATGNIGCLVQIASGARVPVVHTVELVDWATGGPAPAAMALLLEQTQNALARQPS